MNLDRVSQMLPPGVSNDELPVIHLEDNARWQTPGLKVAESIGRFGPVKYVLEKIEPDRYVVFVILEDDPEELLDAIFECERSLYGTFERMPFDVRVIKEVDGWDDGTLVQQSIVRYQRP